MAAIIASLAMVAPAEARTRFEPYEARNSIVEGQGGSRTTKDGVDFWTMGDPPRRYQIVGVITDRRGTGWLAGNAVGSSSVAKIVKEAGCDAVIVLDQSSQVTGYFHYGQANASGNSAYGTGWSEPIERATTRMLVIKYLAPVQAQQPQQANPSQSAPTP